MNLSPRLLYLVRSFPLRLLRLMVGGGLLLALPTIHAQQAGNVDPGFGASLGLAGNMRTVLVQPDGKVLAAGDFQQSIVRLNADGNHDSSFVPKGGANADTLQPDGKILIGGNFASVSDGSVPVSMGLGRLNADGSLDTRCFGRER